MNCETCGNMKEVWVINQLIPCPECMAPRKSIEQLMEDNANLLMDMTEEAMFT